MFIILIYVRTYIKTLPWPVKSFFEENIWRLFSAITVLIMRGHPFHLLLCPPGIPINTKISQKLTFTLSQQLLSIIYIYKCVKIFSALSHMTGVISPLTPLNIYFYSISRPCRFYFNLRNFSKFIYVNFIRYKFVHIMYYRFLQKRVYTHK